MKIEKCAINNNTVHNDVIGIYIILLIVVAYIEMF